MYVNKLNETNKLEVVHITSVKDYPQNITMNSLLIKPEDGKQQERSYNIVIHEDSLIAVNLSVFPQQKMSYRCDAKKSDASVRVLVYDASDDHLVCECRTSKQFTVSRSIFMLPTGAYKVIIKVTCSPMKGATRFDESIRLVVSSITLSDVFDVQCFKYNKGYCLCIANKAAEWIKDLRVAYGEIDSSANIAVYLDMAGDDTVALDSYLLKINDNKVTIKADLYRRVIPYTGRRTISYTVELNPL